MQEVGKLTKMNATQNLPNSETFSTDQLACNYALSVA